MTLSSHLADVLSDASVQPSESTISGSCEVPEAPRESSIDSQWRLGTSCVGQELSVTSGVRDRSGHTGSEGTATATSAASLDTVVGTQSKVSLVWAESRQDLGEEGTLFAGEPALLPPESAQIGRAAQRRIAEYTTVRVLGRRALQSLGMPPSPILHGEKRAPLWPRGIVGAITHCDSFRATAVAKRQFVRSLGIDAEPQTRLSEGVLHSISLPSEREWISAVSEDPSIRELAFDKLLFCAKESVYKTWFPLTHQWLGFEDAHLSFNVERLTSQSGISATDEGSQVDASYASGTFEAHILIDSHPIDEGAPLRTLSGRWSIRNGLIVTGIVLPHS